ncbi:hypothetical protein EB821_05410 [Candidatus Marinimicrobia bacterium PRS2]|nr:hypothetical protein EB821_05410 [Candidatus Marinimicrobia bacterium PRS2]
MIRRLIILLLIVGCVYADTNIPKIGTKFDYEYNTEWKLVHFIDFIGVEISKLMKLEIQNILNPNIFLIDVIYEIVDTAMVEIIYSDSLETLVEKIEQKHIDPISYYKISENNKYYNILITRAKFTINIDKSFALTDEIREMIWIVFEKTLKVERDYCPDCLIFNSVDINKYKSKNKPLSLNRDDIYDDSWAVIIGIDKYKYSKQLNYAVKDAEAVKDMLISKFDFPEDNIKYLVNEEATLSGIKLALDDISTSADENDRILIFYSGHGETIQGIDGTEKGYIIPYEGKQTKAYATGLAMDEILTISMFSKSKHMLFLMDACYSGLMTQQFKGLAKPTEEGYLTKVANESARQIITAGGRDEQVIERDEWQHSAFTKNLLEGLETWDADYNQDGYITADELSSYLREHVTEDSDFQQTPQDGRFKNSGGGEFVFFSDATITIPSSNIDKQDEIIYGCMDENANNYNPNATKPDRSCQYGTIISSLEFGQFDEVDNIVPIIMNNNESISSFEFEVVGVKVVNVFGGIAEENGFIGDHFGIVSYEDEVFVVGYSVSAEMDIISGGNQILCYLKVELLKDISLNNMCMYNIKLVNSKGKYLKNIYNASLTCYDD